MKTSIATLPVTSEITPYGVPLTNGQYDFLLTETEIYRNLHHKIDWNKIAKLFNDKFNTTYSLRKIKKTNNQFTKKNIMIWQTQQQGYVGEDEIAPKGLEEKKLHIQSSIFQNVISTDTSSNDTDSSNYSDSSNDIDFSYENYFSAYDEQDPFSFEEIHVNENEDISRYLQ